MLYVQSFLRSMFKPDQDLGKAKRYALVALKEKPCASTYLGYATVNMYLAQDGKQPQATPVVKTYLNKYLSVANPKDVWRHYLVEMCRRWLKSQGQ